MREGVPVFARKAERARPAADRSARQARCAPNGLCVGELRGDVQEGVAAAVRGLAHAGTVGVERAVL